MKMTVLFGVAPTSKMTEALLEEPFVEVAQSEQEVRVALPFVDKET